MGGSHFNANELKKSVGLLLESLTDILALGGKAYAPAHAELAKLLKEGNILEAESLKRHAFSLANVMGDISSRLGGQIEVKDLPESSSTKVETAAESTSSKVETAPGGPAKKVETAGSIIDAESINLFASTVQHVCSFRPNSCEAEAEALVKLAKTGRLSLQELLRRLVDLIVAIRERLWEERTKAFEHIGNILKTLEAAEKDFMIALSSEENYINEDDLGFTQIMEEGLRELGTLIVPDLDNWESLCRELAEKVGKLQHSIDEKKKSDIERIKALNTERVAVEKRLEQSKRDYDEFTRQSHEMLSEIEVLRAISLKDPLTEAFNRRAYDKQIGQVLEALKNNTLKTCCLVVFDIDLFRDFNNKFGHLAGDSVLAYVARIARECLRTDDLFFRYGGDEFIILLPNSNLSSSLMVAEKIRRSVNSVEFKLFKNSDVTVKVGISMGVAEFEAADDAEKLFARADKALYKAKSNGRNQVSS